jgi:hypothetical protein
MIAGVDVSVTGLLHLLNYGFCVSFDTEWTRLSNLDAVLVNDDSHPVVLTPVAIASFVGFHDCLIQWTSSGTNVCC